MKNIKYKKFINFQKFINIAEKRINKWNISIIKSSKKNSILF